MSSRLAITYMDDTVAYYQDFTDWKYASRDGVPVVLIRTGPEHCPGQIRTEIPLLNVRSIHMTGASLVGADHGRGSDDA